MSSCLVCGHDGSAHTTLVGPGCTSCGCTNTTMGPTKHGVPRAEHDRLVHAVGKAADALAADADTSATTFEVCEALRRNGTEPQVRPVAPWWAPYHVFGVPFASGGPGTAGGAHGPDEWAEIEGLRRLMHVTYDALTLL